MRRVERGWIATLGLALSVCACAYSVGSTFDPWNTLDGAVAPPVNTGATESTPPPPSGSSSGGSFGITYYDGGSNRDAEAGVVDTGAIPVVAIDSGNETAAPCTAQSCSTGCCDSSGRCAGTSDIACGKGGGACLNCTLTGGTCSAGACTSSSSSSSSGGGRDAGGGLFGCNAISCFLGCCKENMCMLGGTNTACGGFGAACQDCTAAKKTCFLGACY